MARTRRSVVTEALGAAVLLALVGVALQLWGVDAGIAYGCALAQVIVIPLRLHRLRKSDAAPKPYQEDDLIRWRRGF